jgi:tRNA (uracil-5-)-methyltransferase
MPDCYSCNQRGNGRRETASQGVSPPSKEQQRALLTSRTIWSFKRGATLPTQDQPFDPSTPDLPADQHVTITNHRLPVYERVGPYLFTFAAGSFFQNNNSILIPLTEYVKEAINPSTPSGSGPVERVRPTHMVDTYCGSGLFGITLSSEFERVAGVEISQDSITAAKRNAEMNGLGGKTEWLCGKAEDIFGGLAEKGFEGGKSCVVCDVSQGILTMSSARRGMNGG